MQVKVKKLNPNAVIPTYAKPGDAALDLTAVLMSDWKGKTFVEYDTCLSVEIPEGFVGLVFPRSSISETCLYLTNSVGVIDSSYRGSIKARFKANIGDKLYNPGDRIAQLIIMPIPNIELVESDTLSNTVRGTGGFGSSGK